MSIGAQIEAQKLKLKGAYITKLKILKFIEN